MLIILVFKVILLTLAQSNKKFPGSLFPYCVFTVHPLSSYHPEFYGPPASNWGVCAASAPNRHRSTVNRSPIRTEDQVSRIGSGAGTEEEHRHGSRFYYLKMSTFSRGHRAVLPSTVSKMLEKSYNSFKWGTQIE